MNWWRWFGICKLISTKTRDYWRWLKPKLRWNWKKSPIMQLENSVECFTGRMVPDKISRLKRKVRLPLGALQVWLLCHMCFRRWHWGERLCLGPVFCPVNIRIISSQCSLKKVNLRRSSVQYHTGPDRLPRQVACLWGAPVQCSASQGWGHLPKMTPARYHNAWVGHSTPKTTPEMTTDIQRLWAQPRGAWEL